MEYLRYHSSWRIWSKPWPLNARHESCRQGRAAGALFGCTIFDFHPEIPSEAGIMAGNIRLLFSYISHLQNLFPGSSSLIFFIADEECCHIFMPRLWAVEVCAVTVKILNLNLVNHNVCCPYGSALCSQFYFIKCYFLDSLSSRIILILHFRTKHANLLWFLASVIFFFSFGFEGFLSVKQEKILLTFL